jgi:hypothetical protein
MLTQQSPILLVRAVEGGGMLASDLRSGLIWAKSVHGGIDRDDAPPKRHFSSTLLFDRLAHDLLKRCMRRLY